MKIYLITGFLGSGKSTYLNNLLSSSEKKTGVLINEFGKISVDTITLCRNGIDLIELKNGSIFCACLKDKFIDGLIELIKMPLDEIYIESSGLSDPSNIQSVMEILEKKVPVKNYEFSGVICLVDAVYFLKQLDVLESVRRQIKHSHFILINKIDLVEENKLDEIRQVIEGINPNAIIEFVSYGKTKCELMDINSFDITQEETTNTVSSRAQSMMLDFNKPVSIDAVEEFFEECTEYLYRAKGYLEIDGEIYKLDVVNDIIQIGKAADGINRNFAELNKVVLLLSKGLAGLKSVSSAAGRIFGDSAILSS